MSSSWHGYPKVYNVGHPAVSSLMDGEVVVQEKVDGSQFSFGLHDGEIKMRSKGRRFGIGEQDKMFDLAAQQVERMAGIGLAEGYTYRCEYLNKPKHNCLAYDREPKNNLVLFDIEFTESSFSAFDDQFLVHESERLEIDCIPTLYIGTGKAVTIELIKEQLETTSFLGGSKIEGIVIKNYEQFTKDGKVMMGKHVSEKFKEIHDSDWKGRHPTKTDVTQLLVHRYKTDARWAKAVQHLKENGTLTNSPKDIGELIKEVKSDVKYECGDEIKQYLFNESWKHIERGITRGLPEWYKEQLLKGQFDE